MKAGIFLAVFLLFGNVMNNRAESLIYIINL